jgi:arginyl-tRNA synthetase
MSSVAQAGSIEAVIKGLFKHGIEAAFPQVACPDILVVAGKKFSDFQCNNAMGLAKLLSTQKPPVKMSPKDIGNALLQSLPENAAIDSAETTDQGFINIRIKASWISAEVRAAIDAGITKPNVPAEKMLVDFSSPNIAKEMHVGHLRSTIIGDTICRILEFCGHDVQRINHVGDWGTQFGMLILYMKQLFPDFVVNPPPISDLVVFYRDAKKKFDEDDEFKAGARAEVVKLQALEPENIAAWKRICDLSRTEFEAVYSRLGVKLEERGESFYNDMIPSVLEELRAAGVVDQSDGAEIIVCREGKEKIEVKDVAKILTSLIKQKRDGSIVFNPALLAGMKTLNVWTTAENGDDAIALNKNGKETKPVAKFDVLKDMDKLSKMVETLFRPKIEAGIAADLTEMGLFDGKTLKLPRFPSPLIARKSDGGFTYDTTDLAGMHHRFSQTKLDRVVIVTDLGQFDHFKMVAQVAQDMGWMANGQRWAHAGFGLVSGDDGKKLKTRSGDTVKLKDLLDEACTRSLATLKERGGDFTEEEMVRMSKVIGFGAIKYFDLKQNRTTDYSFSYDKMLDFNGNTAVYLLYSYARICSIMRKAGADMAEVKAATPVLLTETEKERLLGLALLKFNSVIVKTAEDLYPHHITDFCYELVGSFSDFYGECKVVGHELQSSRLLLLQQVAATLKFALGLLGIDTLEKL